MAPSALAAMSATEKDKVKNEVRKEIKNALAQLYKLHPTARNAIAKSAGYAVFDNFGTNLFLLSTRRGKGIATDNATKKEIFMKMISVGAGIGIGVKDFRAIFVFETK